MMYLNSSKTQFLNINWPILALVSTIHLSSVSLNGQTGNTGWQQWEKIYSDSYITVELQYYYSNTACDQNGKLFKFRGRLTGQYRTSPLFVNFKSQYIGCDGNLYWKQNAFKLFSPTGEQINSIMDESLDYKFSASSIDLSYYDVQAANTQMTGSGFMAFPTSEDPSEIEGRNAIFYGEKTKLTVKGGRLGIDADWAWYTDSCGLTKVGTGPSIEVAPLQSETYYVRAEGTYNTTNCANITVTVDKRSTDPSLILGKPEICRGTDVTLTVSGGSLGLGAKWVWYEGNCGTRKIGEGSSIKISPSSADYYFVRAESAFNITNCAKFTINVVESSEGADEITSNLHGGAICQGQSLELKVKGGRLAKGAVWTWYSGSCGSSRIGNGESISLNPSYNTTFFVRAEGSCNTTDCVSMPVKVNATSISPSFISVEDRIFKGKKTTLSVSGGNLGKDAVWKWYKDDCGSGEPVGTGATITIKPRRKILYAVRAEGTCNYTNCATTSITPIKTHHFERTYNAGLGAKKILHIGFGLGSEIQKIVDEAISKPITGFGLKGEFGFHPFIKEYLSLGFIASGALGTTWPNDNENTKEIRYLYTRFNLNSEFAFGFKKIKFLFARDKTIQPNDYRETLKDNSSGYSKYSFNETLKSEMLAGGLRFGHYTRAKHGKRGDTFDLTYTLTQNTEKPFSEFGFEKYDGFSDWYVGAGINWWRQSKFKLQFDIKLNVTQANFNISDPDFNGAWYRFSFIWNRNLFY